VRAGGPLSSRAVRGQDSAYFCYVASGGSYYTAETHLRHLNESRAGDKITVATQLIDADEKRLHLFHQITRDGDLLATAEQMLLHVDTARGRVSPAPPDLIAQLQAMASTHASLPAPDGLGRRIEPQRGRNADRGLG